MILPLKEGVSNLVELSPNFRFKLDKGDESNIGLLVRLSGGEEDDEDEDIDDMGWGGGSVGVATGLDPALEPLALTDADNLILGMMGFRLSGSSPAGVLADPTTLLTVILGLPSIMSSSLVVFTSLNPESTNIR